MQQTGRRQDSARQAAARAWPIRGHTGAAALVLWARVCPLAPLSPGAYKYPLGFCREEIYSE